MKTKIVALTILSLLVSFAPIIPHRLAMAQTAQTANSPADHKALVNYYEKATKDMQEKLQEHKKMYEEYEAHKEYYGRRGLDMEAMCRGLIRFYGQAVEQNIEMAEAHRKLALETQ